MLFDTHTHINFRAFQDDADEVIRRALEKGISMILPGSQITTSQRAVEISEKYPEGVYAAVGVHPVHVEDDREVDVEEMQNEAAKKEPWMTFRTRGEDFAKDTYRRLAESPNVVAIGEIGLDYYRLPKSKPRRRELKERQREILRAQLELALELDLPVILHCRSAQADLLEMLGEESFAGIRGVAHSFTGSAEDARRYLDLGFFLGFNGLIFKNVPSLPDPKEIIREIPLERIVVETDAPYLVPPADVLENSGFAPTERNEPLFVKCVAEEIARIKNISLKEVALQTAENAKTLFRLTST